MNNGRFDVVIVGGGVGGCAAALALRHSGLRVALVEPCDWIGGQLTSQAVPPDEHPWIEQCGCTYTYRRFRDGVRREYSARRRITPSATWDRRLNPGGGWVSKLCFEPETGVRVLNEMLRPQVESGSLTILRGWRLVGADASTGMIRSVNFATPIGKQTLEGRIFLDATELGDLLPLAEVRYRVGSEAKRETGEAHATEEPEPENVQGITWCFAMAYDPDGDFRSSPPERYEFWRKWAPSFWTGPLLSWNTVHAHTGEPFTWTHFGHEHERGIGLFDYRQIVSKQTIDEPGTLDATIVNWPQNDYFLKCTLELSPAELQNVFEEAKQLSKCLLHWLQNDAPRPDGRTGYPGLHLRPDLTGTEDGFAQYPYIRESRRIEALFTILEQHVSTHDNPGCRVAPSFWDSVGVGAYRIDLHPSTNGRGTVDFSSLPFEIPLGALIPRQTGNLIAAGKCIGTTHITNGCYRLHPVEWNIGEAAGVLAAYCLERSISPQDVYSDRAKVAEIQARLASMGVDIRWPEFGPL